MAGKQDVLILSSEQIDQKINRMAHQVFEENFDDQELLLAGIDPQGYELASILAKKLKSISGKKIELGCVKLNKTDPLSDSIDLDKDLNPENKTVILIDDVLNTGKTLFYALSPFLRFKITKLQTLVLVHRSHNNFPVFPDFIGISLATSLQEHIEVKLEGKEKGVYLR